RHQGDVLEKQRRKAWHVCSGTSARRPFIGNSAPTAPHICPLSVANNFDTWQRMAAKLLHRNEWGFFRF
ncbi:hypothetical protein, partial [uncultured Tateyamaria sp.]|uniref:hypothetical protein n=1 Tax=uncultured Tateyamaria sp. TaxID=455651 RepID=UPI00261B78E0